MTKELNLPDSAEYDTELMKSLWKKGCHWGRLNHWWVGMPPADHGTKPEVAPSGESQRSADGPDPCELSWDEEGERAKD